MKCRHCRAEICDDGYGVLVHQIETENGIKISGSYFCYPKNWQKSVMASAK